MTKARRVKIIATLGPATSSAEMIAAMVRAGVDVFRINMSHSSHEALETLARTIRECAAQEGRNVATLADLQGPKLRVGLVRAEGARLERGKTITLVDERCEGNADRVHLPHPEIFTSVAPGHRLLLDDGRLALRVLSTDGRSIEAEIEVSGILTSRKGVSLPDTDLPIKALTAKDQDDLAAALACDVDWIALSFVQRADDLAEVKKHIRGRAGIVSKIEKPQALRELEPIIALSDAVMIARGDLGVEVPFEDVPALQKQITRLCRLHGCPVIVATQMLESMIASPVPTRAEVSDVASAVLDGADAIMLSAESATGQYPLEAIRTMQRVAIATECGDAYRETNVARRLSAEPTVANAIACATREIAETLSASVIATYTTSGSTANLVARERPFQLLLAISPNPKVVRRLALSWGVDAVLSDTTLELDELVDHAGTMAKDSGIASSGDRIVITAGLPMNSPGSTNFLRVAFVPGLDVVQIQSANQR